jgi:hypothetical protein
MHSIDEFHITLLEIIITKMLISIIKLRLHQFIMKLQFIMRLQFNIMLLPNILPSNTYQAKQLPQLIKLLRLLIISPVNKIMDRVPKSSPRVDSTHLRLWLNPTTKCIIIKCHKCW